MSKIVIFLLMAIANKIIRDTLPDLSLIKGFQRFIVPWLFIGYLYWLHAKVRRSKNPAVKNRLQHQLLTLTAAIVVASSVGIHKKAE